MGLRVLGVVENMSGLQQRMPQVRFELQGPPPSSSGAAADGAAAAAAAARTDVTARVAEILQRELGLADLSQLVVCTDVFERGGGGADKMCHDMGVPLLGRVPLDPALGAAAEQGRSVFPQAAEAGEAGHDAGTPGGLLCLGALLDIVDKITCATTA